MANKGPIQGELNYIAFPASPNNIVCEFLVYNKKKDEFPSQITIRTTPDPKDNSKFSSVSVIIKRHQCDGKSAIKDSSDLDRYLSDDNIDRKYRHVVDETTPSSN
jgi:hypothetical protein